MRARMLRAGCRPAETLAWEPLDLSWMDAAETGVDDTEQAHAMLEELKEQRAARGLSYLNEEKKNTEVKRAQGGRPLDMTAARMAQREERLALRAKKAEQQAVERTSRKRQAQSQQQALEQGFNNYTKGK